MKTDLFQFCGHCWVLKICCHIECSIFRASSFRIWSSSNGIPSPPLALFIMMLPSFLYSSSLYSCHLFLISSASVRSIPFLSLNYCTVALISHASKVMLKILQARLQQYVNRELSDVQAGFRKGEGPEIKLPTSAGSWKKQESSRKTSIFALLTMPKPLTMWIAINCGKFWKRWEYQTTWPASWEICMQVRKQQLELDMEQQTDSK